LDTGREDCLNVKKWGCIHPDQVEWFREEHFKIGASDPSKGKGLLFIHIPIPEYYHLYNNVKFYGTKGESISCASLNTGLVGALIEQKTVEWVTCGHDHNNDYWGTYQSINLAYGRKTGFGSYGENKNGARVFEIT
jgi:hypothetical protein